MAGGPWPRKVYRSTLNPSLPSACPEPGNPGEQFRPDGHYPRSACFCVLGPSGRHPSPDTRRPNRRAYKLRQQPVEAPGAWTARGSFLWRSRCLSEGCKICGYVCRIGHTDLRRDSVRNKRMFDRLGALGVSMLAERQHDHFSNTNLRFRASAGHRSYAVPSTSGPRPEQGDYPL
jgi:hypothetical protein